MTPSRRDHGILVRPLAAEDAAGLHAAVRDSLESLSYWFDWCHPGYGLADAQAWIARGLDAWRTGSEFPLGIFDARSGALLGGTGINRLDRPQRSANLGYWMCETRRGEGIATRAAALAAAMAFEDLGLDSLRIVLLPHNRASQRVAEKLGAIRETLACDRLMFQGQPHEAWVYTLTPQGFARRAR